MAKIWAGRTDGAIDLAADGFNSSLPFDKRLYREDITGSMAHAAMLGKAGILTEEEVGVLIDGLSGILEDLENGSLSFDPDAEDIHSFVEQVLTERVGEAGKKLHTARSRNDQVALDLRLYLRGEIDQGNGEGGTVQVADHARIYAPSEGAAGDLRPSSDGLRHDAAA